MEESSSTGGTWTLHMRHISLSYSKCSKENSTNITVLSDSTNVFVLLLHYDLDGDLELTVRMESPIKDRVVVDISKIVENHRDIISEILAAHALSGCDTVACCSALERTLS
jgi:hypothetical protein